jgi:hypothetical protein
MAHLLRIAAVTSVVALGSACGGGTAAADTGRDALGDVLPFQIDVDGPMRAALLTFAAESVEARTPIVSARASGAAGRLELPPEVCDLGSVLAGRPDDAVGAEPGPYPMGTSAWPPGRGHESEPGRSEGGPHARPGARPHVKRVRLASETARGSAGRVVAPGGPVQMTSGMGWDARSAEAPAALPHHAGSVKRPGYRYGATSEAAEREQRDDLVGDLPIVAAGVAGLLALLAVQMRLNRRRPPEI